MAAVFRISIITMAAIASRLIEKEKLTIFRIIAVVLGVIGIVLMTQPEFIFGEKHSDLVNGIQTTSIAGWGISNTTSLGMHLEYSSTASSVENGISSADFDNLPNNTQNMIEVSTAMPADLATSKMTAPSPVTMDPTTNCSTKSTSHISFSSTLRSTDTKSKSIFPTEGLSENTLLIIGICLSVAAGFIVVVEGICMKRQAMADYNIWKTSFWVGTVGLLCSVIISLSLEDMVFIATVKDLSLVATYGISASLHLFTFLYAINKASYLIVAVIMVTQIAFNLLAQYTVLSSIFPGKHNLLEILGGVMVLVAAALPSVKEALTKYLVKAQKIHFLACSTVRLASLPITKSSQEKRGPDIIVVKF